MAGEFLGRLLVKIGGDNSELNQSISSSQTALKRFGDRASQIGATLTRRLTLPIAAAGAAALKFAIDAEETRAKFETAFSGIEDTADRVSENLQEGFGLSSLEAERLLSSTGDLLKGFGATAGEALTLSSQVQELAVDLASYNNVQGGAATASEALTAALLGERERLKQLGIVIRQEDVNQQLLLNGQQDLTGQARLLAQAQATLQLAVAQSGDAIGDFARTQDSAANQLRVLKGEAVELAADFGKELLPVFVDVVRAVRNAVGFFSDLDDSTKRFILTIGGFVAAIGPAISAIGAFSKSLAFLSANPVFAVIAGVTAIGVAIAGVAREARAAQLEEIEERFEGIADGSRRTAEAIELAEGALVRGGFNAGLENAREQVRVLSENLGLTQRQVAEIGIRSENVSETYKEQLRIIRDEIVGQLSIYQQNTEARLESERLVAERLAEQARLEAERAAEAERINTIAAEYRATIEEQYRLKLQDLEATTDIEKIENERAQAIQEAADNYVRSGEAINLINQYYDRQVELIREAEQAEADRLEQQEQEARERTREALEEEFTQKVFEQSANRIEILEQERDARLEQARELGAETADIETFYANEIAATQEQIAEEERARREQEQAEAQRLADEKVEAKKREAERIAKIEEERIEREREAAEDLAERRARLEEDFERKVFELSASRIDILERERDEAIEQAEELGAERADILTFYEQKITDALAEENQKRIDEARKYWDTRLSFAQSFTGEIGDFVTALAQIEINSIENTLLSEEEKEEEIRKIRRRQAQREKALGIAEATIDTAKAIIGFLADPGGVLGTALSVAAGVTGAVQIAAIAGTPLPQLAEGGFFNGPAIVGEGGPEVAVPLSGPQGERALGLMADKIASAIEARGNTVQTTNNVTLQSNSIFPSFESRDRLRDAARLLLPELEAEAKRRGSTIFGGVN